MAWFSGTYATEQLLVDITKPLDNSTSPAIMQPTNASKLERENSLYIARRFEPVRHGEQD